MMHRQTCFQALWSIRCPGGVVTRPSQLERTFLSPSSTDSSLYQRYPPFWHLKLHHITKRTRDNKKNRKKHTVRRQKKTIL